MAAWRTIAARALVAIVFALNVMCAIQFVCAPDAFTEAYSLQGPGAAAAIRGFGVAFLMWNATYPPVIAHPGRYRVLFRVVLAQQAIGLGGETAILCGIDAGLALHASILRFIAFDATGLCLMALAYALTRSPEPKKHASG